MKEADLKDARCNSTSDPHFDYCGATWDAEYRRSNNKLLPCYKVGDNKQCFMVRQ